MAAGDREGTTPKSVARGHLALAHVLGGLRDGGRVVGQRGGGEARQAAEVALSRVQRATSLLLSHPPTPRPRPLQGTASQRKRTLPSSTLRARAAQLSVQTDSSALKAAGERQPNMSVLESFSSESCSMCVSVELR